MVFHVHRFHDEELANGFADLARRHGHKWVCVKRPSGDLITVTLFY